MTPEDITARIRTALPDAEVRVVDTTGGADIVRDLHARGELKKLLAG